jgi:hypothetical protein
MNLQRDDAAFCWCCTGANVLYLLLMYMLRHIIGEQGETFQRLFLVFDNQRYSPSNDDIPFKAVQCDHFHPRRLGQTQV